MLRTIASRTLEGAKAIKLSSSLIRVFLFLFVVGVTAPFAVSQTQDWLSTLPEARSYTQKRSSSFDPSGGNADFRPIAPGETLTVFDEAGPATITHLWFTIADDEA